MPQKNSVKIYYENAFYHTYNRGVEKRDIFLAEDDYSVFLHLLKTALLPPETGLHPAKAAKGSIKRKNFYGQINLLCYCLMPNHYHLLLKQSTASGLTNFIRSISTSYVMYFNKKYHRVGSLFQGIFKAVNIDNDNYLLWVSRYIHRNPGNFKNYSYSSYPDFIGKVNHSWVDAATLLEYFRSVRKTREKNYQEFVEAEQDEPMDLGNLFLE